MSIGLETSGRAAEKQTSISMLTAPVTHSTLKAPAENDRNQPGSHNQHNEVRLFHSSQWDDLSDNQPFYAQVNLPVVERAKLGWNASEDSPWYGSTHPSIIDPDQVEPPPYYPNHPVTRKEWAGYLDSICGMDTRVGVILDRLEEDGLSDDTVVMFVADNGRLELRGLDRCYDSGDRVPLIIRWPKNFPTPSRYKAGSVNHQLVSLSM